jgi:F-type H+-transporting ATPase subunit delta
MSIKVANRYARALADIVARSGEYRKILQELYDFYAAYRESVELREVLSTPAVTLEQKVRLVQAITEKLGASQITFNFLRVLLAHYRMALLGEVVQAFREISNDRLGIVQVKISAAEDLSETEQKSLQARFGELTKRRVELELHLDASLLGGVMAQIGSTVYDGTIRGYLERIREQLVAE